MTQVQQEPNSYFILHPIRTHFWKFNYFNFTVTNDIWSNIFWYWIFFLLIIVIIQIKYFYRLPILDLQTLMLSFSLFLFRELWANSMSKSVDATSVKTALLCFLSLLETEFEVYIYFFDNTDHIKGQFSVITRGRSFILYNTNYMVVLWGSCPHTHKYINKH